MSLKKTTVTIFNQTFDISSSTLAKEHLEYLAQFVDERMKNTFQSTKLSSALKVAVLTALNLAEELVSLKKEAATVPSVAENQSNDSSITPEISTVLLNFIRRIDSLNHQIQLFEHYENDSE